jgi:hypothetical protein
MNSGLTGNVIGEAIAVVPLSTAAANTARKTVERVRISILLLRSEEPVAFRGTCNTCQQVVAILPQQLFDSFVNFKSSS